MESLKTESRFISIATTVVMAVVTYIAAMEPDRLASFLPARYAPYAALIVVVAAAIVNQYSEELRVKRAEDIILDDDYEEPVKLNNEGRII